MLYMCVYIYALYKYIHRYIYLILYTWIILLKIYIYIFILLSYFKTRSLLCSPVSAVAHKNTIPEYSDIFLLFHEIAIYAPMTSERFQFLWEQPGMCLDMTDTGEPECMRHLKAIQSCCVITIETGSFTTKCINQG